MLAKRIIPCLDVDRGQVVKGVHFQNLRPMGDPVECAAAYNDQGADELVFLDITATSDGRDTMEEVVRRTARKVFIPLTVGGGIRTVADFRRILRAGADKVAVNSAAVQNPRLIADAATLFGSQCVVVAMDAKKTPDGWHVYVKGGRQDTKIDLLEWVATCQKLGAGEILLTSMDADGTKNGFDLPMLRAVCARVSIPVIASGGCGSLTDFEQVFAQTQVDAALAASLFHEGTLTVAQVKSHLRGAGISVRPQVDLEQVRQV